MTRSSTAQSERGIRGSLRLRLAMAVIATVVVVSGIGLAIDYRREHRVLVEGVRGSLEEQAQALAVARRRMRDPGEFASYVDAFCAQMNERISPGHHILILDESGEVVVRARHHSGPEVEGALLAADASRGVLSVAGHRLVQVRLNDTDSDGHTVTIVLAQYLDRTERMLQAQLISRTVTTGAVAVAIIALVFLTIRVWVVSPLHKLAEAARAWSARDFAARTNLTGAVELRLLANALDSMADELGRHERNRAAELERARTIQAGLLPTSMPPTPGLRLIGEYRPAADVTGDLYDVIDLPDGTKAVAILDVTGHGISAALLTGVVKMALRSRLIEAADPARALELANGDLLACTADGHYATVCVGVWNQADRTWTYSAAGHPGGLLLVGGAARHLPATGPILGVMADGQWHSERVELGPGDRLFLYTDGVTEAGAPNRILGAAGLEQVLTASDAEDLADQVSRLFDAVELRQPGPPADDVTIVAMQVESE